MGERERWGTRVGLILAMAGNAVGLGNFLRFPVQAAQNGGGAFMIPYFFCFLLLGIPLMWVEWSIGRHGGRYGHSSTPGMMERLWRHPLAKYAGVLGLFMPLVVMVYYTYIESWSLGYAMFSATGRYWGASAFEPMRAFLHSYQGYAPDMTDPAVAGAGLHYFTSVWPAYALFALTLGTNVWILSKGVSGGIEAIAKIAMPTLFLFAFVLVIRVLTLGTPDPSIPDASVAAGMGFVWNPVPEALTNPNVWLAAAGQVDFDRLVEQAEKTTEGWEPGQVQRSFPPVTPHADRQSLLKPSSTQQYVVQIGPGPDAEDEDRFAAQLLATVIGDDTGSRFYWDLVETGRAEYAGMNPYEFQRTGITMSYFCCAPETTADNLQRVARIVDQVQQQAVTARELELAKNKTCSYVVRQSERPSNRLFSIGNNWVQRRQYETVEQRVAAYQRVTLDDIRRVLERFPLNLQATVTVGPLAKF